MHPVEKFSHLDPVAQPEYAYAVICVRETVGCERSQEPSQGFRYCCVAICIGVTVGCERSMERSRGFLIVLCIGS